MMNQANPTNAVPRVRAFATRCRSFRIVIAFVCAMIAGGAFAQTTGFKQSSVGPFDYNTGANWVGGALNGLWDSSLTLTAAQTVTFAADTTLSCGLSFNYAGNFLLTLDSSSSTTRTLTLGGDVVIATSGGLSANVTLGNSGNKLNINLGGATRTINVGAGRTLTVYNVVSNGGITKSGAGTLLFEGGVSTYDGTLTINGGIVINRRSGGNGLGSTVGQTVINSDGTSSTGGQLWLQPFGAVSQTTAETIVIQGPGESGSNTAPAVVAVQGSSVTTSGSIVLNGTGTYRMQCNPININPCVLNINGGIARTSTNVGPLTLEAAGQGSNTIPAQIVIGSAISNNGGPVTITGANLGVVTFNAAGHNIGDVTINGAAGGATANTTLKLGLANALPTASSINVANGTFDLNGFTQTVNNFTVGSNGTVAIGVDRASAAAAAGYLVVIGTAGASGGMLTVTNSGAAFQQGDVIHVFNSAVPGFGAVNLPSGLPAGLTFRNRIGLDGSIVVTSTAPQSFYVSPSGSDTNPGTLAAPMNSPSLAASILNPGDTLYLRAGTYRETLAMSRSGAASAPIVISAYDAEAVTISGCDLVTGAWTSSTNNSYVTSVGWTLGEGYDQVFVDGTMQYEAQFPNWSSTNSLLAPAMISVSVKNDYTISCASFAGLSDLSGAHYLGTANPAWGVQHGIITSKSGTTISIDSATVNDYWFPNKYYSNWSPDPGMGLVYGKLSLLDADGEWFVDASTGNFYLRIPGGVSPAGHTVELKRRLWCIDFNGQSYVTVRGLQTRAGAIQIDGSGDVLDGCDTGYMSHFLDADGAGQPIGGITLNGSNNVVSGCTIHDTAGSGILANGSQHLITRNHIFTTAYDPIYATQHGTFGSIWLGGTNCTISFNSIHDSGRDLLSPGGAGHTIVFNDLYGHGWMTKDTGAIYIGATDAMDASGYKTRIAYNWVHDARPNPVGTESNTYHNGIYIDGGDHNFKVDHNVCWNFAHNGYYDQGITLNFPNDGDEVYNNTLFNCASYEHTFSSWSSNVYYSYTAQNNLVSASTANISATLMNAGADDFRLVPGCSAIDPVTTSSTTAWAQTNAQGYVFNFTETTGTGIALPGVNSWVPDGKPDNGAYEYNGPNWQPGMNGWEGWKMDAPLAVGARTALVQGSRISLDTSTSTSFRLYYGTTDGGTNTGTWDAFIDLGTVAPGDVMSVFRRTLFGLASGTTYYARYYSSNASGEGWSAAQSFTTAASLTWDAGGGATTNISTNTNWSGDPAPDLTNGGEIATFGSAGSSATIDTNVSLLGIVINRDANFTIANGAGSLTLGSAGITVTLPSTTSRTHVISVSNIILAADQTWSITNNGAGTAQLNMTSSITGAYGFTKAGAGNLLLGASSSFTGEVYVNAGPVVISNNYALGSSAGPTTIYANGSSTTGGQVSLSGNITVPENFNLAGTTEAGSFAFALNNSSGANTIDGAITLFGSGGFRFGASSGTLTLNGAIARSGTDSGSLLLAANTGSVVNAMAPIDLNGGAFYVINPGTVVLFAQSTDIGSTTIYFGSPATNGPTLKLGINDALPPSRNLTLGTTGNSNGADRGTLDLAGYNQTVNALVGSVGTGSTPSGASTRRITNSAAGTLSTLTIGNGNASSTFNGLIENGTGQVALVKNGTGTITLASANTYTGSTTVNAGTLALNTASLATSSTLNLSTGAVLNLNFTGTNNIATFTINGLVQAPGTWGGLTSAAAHKTALIAGSGVLNFTGPQPPYDAWALAAGLDNSSPAKDATPTADPCHIGVPNLVAYAMNMNPGISGAVLQAVANSGGVLALVYTTNKAATDVTYVVEWSDTLATNSWSTNGVSAPVVLSDNGVTQQIKVVVPSGAGVMKRFLRLKVTKP